MVKYIEKYDKKALTLGIKEKIAVVIFFGLIIAIYLNAITFYSKKNGLTIL